MKRNNSKSEGPRIEGLNIYDYKFREYLCVFDRKVGIPNRLRNLTIGLQLYSQYGFSPDQFIGFHINKQRIMNTTMGAVIVLLIVVELLFLFKLPSWVGREVQYGVGTYLLAASTAWFIFYSIRNASKNIRANFTHVNSALSSNTCLRAMLLASVQDQAFFKTIAEGVMDGDLDGKFITHPSVTSLSNVAEQARDIATVLNRPTALKAGDSDTVAQKPAGIGNDNDVPGFDEPIASEPLENGVSKLPTFQNQLIELSCRKNEFNDLRMIEVINFFYIMCCPEMEEKVPQMSPEDFLSFLKMGFLGEPSIQNLTFKNAKQKRKYIFAIFYGFMVKSQDEVGESSNYVRERYAALIFSHFRGFNKENSMNNFSKEEKVWLERLRKENKDKIPVIQELPN